jgi:sec-independent protein translocase protein TatB
MFDIGWTEMLVIAVVMIVVVGPKDLPGMLRTFGRTATKLRSMAGDFQKQFNDALKEAELDDVKKSVDALRGLNPVNEIKKQLNPFEKAASEVRAGLDTLKPKPPEPASPVAVAAEPLKNGAAAMPGDASASPVAADTSSAPVAVSGPVEPAPAPKPRKPRAAKTQAATTEAAKPKAAPRKKKSESSPT